MSPSSRLTESILHSFPSTLQLFILVSLLTVWDVILPTNGQNTPPTLKLSLALMGKDVLTASEETPKNSLLALLEVVDPDKGPAGEVECRIDNKFVGLGNMANNYYKVELVNYLDREEMDVVKVDIICTDNGSPPISKKAFFTIVVTDVNDNVPTFTNDLFSFSLPEESDKGTKVGVAKAFDADEGENGKFEYSLEDEDEEISILFSIDATSGEIVSLVPFDREMKDTFQLFVYATDHGIPPLIGEAKVTIKILDINDHTPTIMTRNMSIDEALPSMSAVGAVITTDLDIDENAEIEYSLVGGEDGTVFPPFIVDSNGQVFTAFPLDREMRDNYIIRVTAADSGDPAFTSTASIYIAVLDVNDNAPIILLPRDDDEPDNGNSSDSVTVDWYGPEEEKIVFKVIAADQDLEENGRVYFAIDFINSKPFDLGDSLFDIDRDKGNIFLRRFVRNGDEAEQILSIFVYDGGNPSLNASASLNVTFTIDFSSLTIPPPTFPVTRIEGHNRGGGGNRETLCIFLFLCNSCLSLFFIHHFKSIFS